MSGWTAGGLRFECRNRAHHKFIEQRHGKSDVAVGRAVDHSFFDQLGAHGPQAADLDAQGIGDVAGLPALQQAMLHVMQNPQFAHPTYWAPYALVGEGGR